MKATFLSGRADSAGKHNDRNFDLTKAEHIDGTRSKSNRYWTYNDDVTKSFEQLELEFYTKHFFKHITEQNKRNEEARHTERNKTIEQYYRHKQTQPEDVILQVGNKNNHVEEDVLWECALEYQKRFENNYGRNCKILDMALHNDEATPHVHIRRVWISEDDYGFAHVSQKRALNELGYVKPDLDRAHSRYNNPKVTFTKQERELFENICKEKGLEIDIDNRVKTEHLSVTEYKQKRVREETEELERYLDTLKSQVSSLESDKKNMEENKEQIENFNTSFINMMETSTYFNNLYREYLEEIRRLKDKKLRDKAIMELYKMAAGTVVSQKGDFSVAVAKAEVEARYSKMRQFLEQKGMMEEYQKYNNQNAYARTTERVRPLI